MKLTCWHTTLPRVWRAVDKTGLSFYSMLISMTKNSIDRCTKRKNLRHSRTGLSDSTYRVSRTLGFSGVIHGLETWLEIRLGKGSGKAMAHGDGESA